MVLMIARFLWILKEILYKGVGKHRQRFWKGVKQNNLNNLNIRDKPHSVHGKQMSRKGVPVNTQK